MTNYQKQTEFQNVGNEPKKKSNAKKEFSLYFDECLETLELRKNGKKMDKKEIAALLGVSYDRFKRFINTENLAKRDCIIGIGFALWFSSKQTDDLLLKYGMAKLCDDLSREKIIKGMLNKASAELTGGKKRVDDFSLERINQELLILGQDPLHVVDKKNPAEKAETSIAKERTNFILLEQKTETRIDEIVLGDWQDSLMTEYFPGRYRIISEFLVKSSDGRRYHRILVEPGSINTYSEMLIDDENSIRNKNKTALLQWDYPTTNGLPKEFNTLEETGELKGFFMIAYNQAIQERLRLTQTLNDSRNYHNRISAKVIDGILHIFTETYNYDFPEKSEYYLMDSFMNRNILFVEKTSCFMLLYLTTEEYQTYFESIPDRGEERYESAEEIIMKRMETDAPVERVILGSRLAAYNRLKDQIDEFKPKLNKSVFIRNPDLAIDEETTIYDYYGLKPDSGYSEEDLMQAFALGLDTIYEIELYRQKSGALIVKET